MTTIKILPEILSNQIAAGEVVQRPSNAVKELVENSIDAGATSITIEIERGGKSLIRVSDNGCGLSRDDALLAIERYATSKIFTKDDLFSISTMGFRGEALPSIASVSKLVLVTRTKNTDTATRIDISGGKLQNVSDAGAPVGTMVEVKHLLFNTPARKKFLKSDNTEISHISDAVWGMALGNPHIQFRLFINGRLQKSFSQNDDLFQRSVNILGRDLADKLYPLKYTDEFIRIHGYCSNPLITRSTSSRIFLFVNNRLIYDRGLISAIFQGYKGRIMKGRFPLGVFFIDIDFDQVDVNVHPSKKEIKFFNARQVYQATGRAIRQAMDKEQQDAASYSHAPVSEFTGQIPTQKEELSPQHKPIEKFEFYDQGFIHNAESKVKEPSLNFPSPLLKNQSSIQDESRFKENMEIGLLDDDHALEQIPHEPPQATTIVTEHIRIIGQAMGTYILAETSEGLMLIDQHAAHERIVYEKLKRRYDSFKGQYQSLVVPETLELNFKEADYLNQILDDLKALGIIVEPFGGNTFVIKSVPPVMDKKEVKPLVVEIIESAMVKKDRFSTEGWLENCLILMACHSAIRANLNLNRMEMEQLVRDLETCENTRHCPHGRPIMISWDKKQIEKLFKRVV